MCNKFINKQNKVFKNIDIHDFKIYNTNYNLIIFLLLFTDILSNYNLCILYIYIIKNKVLKI